MSRKRKGCASVKKKQEAKNKTKQKQQKIATNHLFFMNKENISHVEEPVFAVHNNLLSELWTSCEHNLFVFKIIQMQRNKIKYIVHIHLNS